MSDDKVYKLLENWKKLKIIQGEEMKEGKQVLLGCDASQSNGGT